MEQLFVLLPALACPFGMVLMMWFMMRGMVGHHESNRPVGQSQPAIRLPQGMNLGFCLNWKVIAGLVAVGLGIWVVAPTFLWAALPLLAVAACPLSMLFMMCGMQGGSCATKPQQATEHNGVHPSRAVQITQLKVQQARLTRQIADLEAGEKQDTMKAQALADS